MREYVTRAIVLERSDAGELDSRVHLYTRSLGKISARATSARKITSKLAPHLEPLTIITARLVSKIGFQIADAVSERRLPAASFPSLRLVRELAAEGEPEEQLWHALTGGGAPLRKTLTALGFDPQFAACRECASPQAEYFSLDECVYYCRACLVNHFSEDINARYLEL
jgi:recombinational DNA repair protein (RecF pathway)